MTSNFRSLICSKLCSALEWGRGWKRERGRECEEWFKHMRNAWALEQEVARLAACWNHVVTFGAAIDGKRVHVDRRKHCKETTRGGNPKRYKPLGPQENQCLINMSFSQKENNEAQPHLHSMTGKCTKKKTRYTKSLFRLHIDVAIFLVRLALSVLRAGCSRVLGVLFPVDAFCVLVGWGNSEERRIVRFVRRGGPNALGSIWTKGR